LKKLAFIAPIIVIYNFLYLAPEIEVFFKNFSEALIALLVLLSIGTVINAFNEIWEKQGKHLTRPIKGYLQIISLIMYIIGGVIIIGIITNQNPMTLITGIGAMTAVLILVFRDTILSFIASIQITSYDLVKVGDWIEVPQFGIDGDIMDIALHTIKVRNFDKTISVFPTHKLVEVSFKNWRGMQEMGGRRIKRPIYIDLSTVKFCDEEMLKKFEKFQLITDYIKNKKNEIAKYNEEKAVDTSELINGRRLTNIGTFREYIKAYLRNREDIHKGLTFLIRQLAPGPNGIPIEIYVFTSTTEWIPYEEIQADIFDHFFAVVPLFELGIYQNPTGKDFNKISSTISN
jgi:miniconductance mechanosensitive channel